MRYWGRRSPCALHGRAGRDSVRRRTRGVARGGQGRSVWRKCRRGARSEGAYGRGRRALRHALLEPVLVGCPMLRETVMRALAARGHLVLCELDDVRFFVDPADRVVGGWLMWHGGWQRREMTRPSRCLSAGGRLPRMRCSWTSAPISGPTRSMRCGPGGSRARWRSSRTAQRAAPCDESRVSMAWPETSSSCRKAAGAIGRHSVLYLHPRNSGAHSIGSPPSVDGRDQLYVPIVRVEDELGALGVPPDKVGLVWIDVEGHEPQVLAGWPLFAPACRSRSSSRPAGTAAWRGWCALSVAPIRRPRERPRSSRDATWRSRSRAGFRTATISCLSVVQNQFHARRGNRQDQDWIEAPGPIMVLVEPQLGENIGAAARVMANFGLARLRLVKPRDGWPNIRAGSASGADRILDEARLFDTVEAAIADCTFVLATTARAHDQAKPVIGPRRRRADGAARRARARTWRCCSGASATGSRTPRWRSPTASSRSRSIRPSPRSTSRRRCW